MRPGGEGRANMFVTFSKKRLKRYSTAGNWWMYFGVLLNFGTGVDCNVCCPCPPPTQSIRDNECLPFGVPLFCGKTTHLNATL